MTTTINQRSTSLDALRGFAIVMMVLSASISFGNLPAWMYHAQTPPPTHAFDGTLPGLTWVDLVFPFFLFAMGAAFPFSIQSRLAKGATKLGLGVNAFSRGLKLAFFAIFLSHFYPYALSNPQDLRSWLWAIAAFVLLFPMFMRIPIKMPKWGHIAVKVGAYTIAGLMLAFIKHADGSTFNIYRSNIIIMILANMAFFATAAYLLTMKSKMARITVLGVLFAIMLSQGIEGSWISKLYTWSPVPWAYHLGYLKYFFIVLTGTMAGELLRSSLKGELDTTASKPNTSIIAISVALISAAIIIVNLIGLQTRHLLCTTISTAILLILGYLLLKNRSGDAALWRRLWLLASALISIGLMLEPFQGGIKKDLATFSYLLLTPGLASIALVFFHIICDHFACRKPTAFLVESGQNPMIAYCCPQLLLHPLLNITGLSGVFIYFNTPLLGFVKGVIITAIAVLVTMFFTRLKWFWRT